MLFPRAPRRRACMLAVAFLFLAFGTAPPAARAGEAPARAAECDPNAGLTLPRGFCASLFADGVGHARHMAVSADGVVYVNSWSGAYYPASKPLPGGFLVALKDTKGTGRADIVVRFGETAARGGRGGTGIALYNGALYAEEGDRILRYALPRGAIAPTGAPEVVLSGLPLSGDHPMHPFAIDAEGRLFVDSASATNACQIRNRTLESPGRRPCAELETRGGVWRYDANGAGQTFSPAERYATGIRNGEGFAVDASGIYVTQHGRDQLAENWPKLFTPARGADLPAEELLKLEQGADYGWPECYYDGARRALVLAPEYGGDGATIGACAQKQAPVAAFPAHWAPNALAIYHGNGFPKAYRGGVFIAFHGSWNRAPAPQGGYNIVFQPLADGRAAGDFVVFADGFAGATKEPGKAAHRPSGLAVGPDGSLYVSDDVSGRIWRITFHGDVETTGVEPAPAAASSAGADNAQPPEGVHPDARRKTRALAVPPGSTAAQVELGRSVFLGRAANGTCAGCHGSDAEGSPIAPDLTKGEWMWSDGSLAGVKKSIVEGVATPKAFNAPMPPLGGARLSDAEVDAVAAYVWAVGHSGR